MRYIMTPFQQSINSFTPAQNQIILRFLEIPSVRRKIVKFFFNGETKAKDAQQKSSTEKAQSPGVPGCAFMMVTVSDDLLSHAATSAVPSAQRGLTSVVGMETGGPPSLLSLNTSLLS